MWSWSSDGAIESRYVVDPGRKLVVFIKEEGKPSKETPECAKRRIERKKRDLETYNRLLERFNNQALQGERDKDLAAALEWMEASSKWGPARADALEASPDGRHAVFSTRSRPLLLINVEALSTHVLAKGHSYLETPVAWAPDSRLVAVAAPDTGEIRLHGLDGVVAARKKTYGARIAALSWSADMQQIAAFAFQNRRMNVSPLGLLFAAAGHPEFRNDGAIELYTVNDEKRWSIPLTRGISEMSSPRIEIEWK